MTLDHQNQDTMKYGLTTAKVVCAFLIIFCKCWFQLSLESKITPKYLTSSSILSSLPWSMRGPKPSIFLLLVNGTMAVLWGLIFRPSFTAHLITTFRASCIISLTVCVNLPWTMVTILSAQPNVLKPRSFVTAKSLSTTRFHMQGDKTPPCWHPLTLAVKLLPVRKVCMSLLSSMYLTHLQQVSSSPRSLAAVIIALKEILSNSPSVPRKAPNTISPWFTDFSSLWTTWMRMSVALVIWHPKWTFLMQHYAVIYDQ